MKKSNFTWDVLFEALDWISTTVLTLVLGLRGHQRCQGAHQD